MSGQTRLSEDARQFRGPPTFGKYINFFHYVKWRVIIFGKVTLWISPPSVEIMVGRAGLSDPSLGP